MENKIIRKTVAIRMPEELIERLRDFIVYSNKISLNEYVVRAVERSLQREGEVPSRTKDIRPGRRIT